jgi:flagellar biosynthesis protein FlhG
MDEQEYKQCCRILEVSPDASIGEIKRSYLSLKELYSMDSIASMALDDEFSAADKQAILDEIEQAFKTLMDMVKKERDLSGAEGGGPSDDAALAEFVSGVDVFDGPALKRVREKMGVTLDDIAVATRIQPLLLAGLEDENFEALPAEVYTRGFVISYAEFLSLDGQTVVADYMGRYRKWKSDNHRGGALANLLNRFKGRR